MITDIRVELVKIRTTRLWLGLLALAAGLTVLLVVVGASRAGQPGRALPSLATAAGLRDLITGAVFALLLAAVFGATVASGEFRHRTATDTYLDQPNRVRVLVAKAVAAGLVGLLFGLVSAGIMTVLGLVEVRVRGYSVTLPASSIAGYVAGAVLACGLLAAAGAALGSLVRGQLAAIIGILVWGLGIETILSGLSPALAKFLPITAGNSLAGVRGGGGMPPLPADFTPLPFAAAVALLLGLAGLLAAIAAGSTVRADIS